MVRYKCCLLTYILAIDIFICYQPDTSPDVREQAKCWEVLQLAQNVVRSLSQCGKVPRQWPEPGKHTI